MFNRSLVVCMCFLIICLIGLGVYVAIKSKTIYENKIQQIEKCIEVSKSQEMEDWNNLIYDYEDKCN